jgi:hypothetical protein
MLRRPYFLWLIALAAVLLPGHTSAPAQTTTDFAPWKEAKNAESIPGRASRMLDRDFRDLTGTARDELLAKTLSALADIVANAEVVPSTRYNAILAAGQLVSKEASPNTPPDAYPAALTYLVEVCQKTDFPYYIQYGALLGIVRHAILGIAPDQQETVIDLLLETAATESSAVAPAVWDWFRQTALDGLAALKMVGTNGKVVTELLSIIDRQSQELENRCRNQEPLTRKDWEQLRRTIELVSKAAKTLGDLDYKSAKDIDAGKMTDAFIRLTRTVCDMESKRALDFAGQAEGSSPPAGLPEQIVTDVKMCTQSVVWGIRGGFLTGKPAENSFYTSLAADDPAIKRLDMLLAEIIGLATFLDEGDKARRAAAMVTTLKTFKFDLGELADVLAKCSEALAKIERTV